MQPCGARRHPPACRHSPAPPSLAPCSSPPRAAPSSARGGLAELPGHGGQEAAAAGGGVGSPRQRGASSARWVSHGGRWPSGALGVPTAGMGLGSAAAWVRPHPPKYRGVQSGALRPLALAQPRRARAAQALCPWKACGERGRGSVRSSQGPGGAQPLAKCVFKATRYCLRKQNNF